MTTENQNIHLEKKTLLRTPRSTDKKAPLKALSLKPTRSMKKSSGIKPISVKLK